MKSSPLFENGPVRLKRCRYGPMLYLATDPCMGRSLDRYGEFAEGQVELFRQLIQPGWTILEVGANLGAHTLFLAQATGPRGVVYAFEPRRIAFQILSANAALCALSNIHARQMAVGGAAATAIDSLDLPACNFLKLDAQGLAADAIAGAQQTLRRFRPVLYVEYVGPEQSASSIRQLLALGYRLYWHPTPLFNPQNYFEARENIFADAVSTHLLGIHASISQSVTGFRPITSPEDVPAGQGRTAAAPAISQAGEISPPSVEELNHRGVVFAQQGRLDEAIAAFQRAAQLRPDDNIIFGNLGLALTVQGKLDEAIACCLRCVELKPDFAEGYSNLGRAWLAQGRLEEALASCRRALELKPGFGEALNRQGLALREQGKLEEAIASYEQILQREADCAEAHFNRSLVWLLQGDFKRGWPEYQWRWRMKQFPRLPLPQPLWDGGSQQGRTILLSAEQGFGDMLQFVRYATLVKARAARVLVQCQRPLLRLLASCRGVDEVIAEGDDLPAFDAHTPLLSLPDLFHTSLETIPADIPYLFADPALVERWRAELDLFAGFKIGIVWQGRPTHPHDHNRSLPLGCFEALAGLPGVRLVSLQKGPGVEQLQELAGRFPITEVGSRLDDFMDTAAVLKNLDLVIACDTAVAHLAGALGVPVWVALPSAPDWRWLLDRSDSPWYPTMRLFRQKQPGDWAGVFHQIQSALAAQWPSAISSGPRETPASADELNHRGISLARQGKLDEAIADFRRAVQIQPEGAAIYGNLGLALTVQGKLDEAIACCRRAVELQPGFAGGYSNLGRAWMAQGQFEEAVASFRRALELQPGFAEAHNRLGMALRQQGKLAEAAASLREALRADPAFAEAHLNLGNVLKEECRLDEAVACYRQALQFKPDYAEAFFNLGIALVDQTKLEEAAACYEQALRYKPDYADAHLNQSFLSLLRGDFQRGWTEYEWRRKTEQCPRRDFTQPTWNGEPLAGRTILLYAEQGLGDALQFVRYAALVKPRCATVIVECPSPLVSLLSSCAGIDRLVAKGEELPPFDAQVSLESLPGIFQTTLENLPATIPYVFADPGLAQRWREELGGVAGLKIGISWQGSPKHRNDRNRSIPLGCFEPLARCAGVRLLSLQKDWGLEQLQPMAQRFPITELGSRLESFRDTAAVLKNLDLLITCDTAVAHLAGALGVPVWVALPLAPDWRWLLDRSDSPWYPTMRLFRQKQPGDWAGVFDEIKTALAARFPSQE